MEYIAGILLQQIHSKRLLLKAILHIYDFAYMYVLHLNFRDPASDSGRHITQEAGETQLEMILSVATRGATETVPAVSGHL